MKTGHLQFDAIVVGSGPGGATVARELSQRNKQVLILEWGSRAPIKGSQWQFLSMAGVPERSLLITSKLLGLVRGVTTGGSSTFYYGTAFDPPLQMLKSHGLDISGEVDDAKRDLPIAPLSDGLIGPMAKRIMASARDLGYDWQKLPKFVYQEKCRPECGRCNYGCPYGAKWNARMFVEEAVMNGAVFIDRAKVTKAIVENGKAGGIEFTRWGVNYRAFAPVVIISAGGIGSPVILRRSGIKAAGYDFFYDPLIAVMGAVGGLKGGREIPMAAGVHMEDEGYLMTDMTVPALIHMGLAAGGLNVSKLFAHPRTLTIMIKAKDFLSGRVTDGGGARKGLTPGDEQKLMTGYARAREILRNAGAKDIYKSYYLASHPGATVKVGHLLDSNLQTEYENLYVCDCAAIPEAWGLPPTLTLIGLGKRLAKHLAGEKKTVAALPADADA